jgi:hypothetical protein
MKDVLSTGEAFSSQKRTFALQNMKFLIFFLLLWVIYARIRILNLDSDPDPTDNRQCEAKSTNTAPPPPSTNQRGHSGTMRDGTEVIVSPPLCKKGDDMT